VTFTDTIFKTVFKALNFGTTRDFWGVNAGVERPNLVQCIYPMDSPASTYRSLIQFIPKDVESVRRPENQRNTPTLRPNTADRHRYPFDQVRGSCVVANNLSGPYCNRFSTLESTCDDFRLPDAKSFSFRSTTIIFRSPTSDFPLSYLI
jgi:hypothetical protein